MLHQDASIPSIMAPTIRCRILTTLSAERTDIASTLNVKEIHQQREDYFAVTFEGLLRIEVDGLYRFIIVSDDGSPYVS